MSDEVYEVRDQRLSGYYWIESAVLKDYGGELGPYGIAVYNALAWHANNDTQQSRPSTRTIAEMTGMSRRQVRRKLRELERLGLVFADRRPRKPTVFTLVLVERNEKKAKKHKAKSGW